MALSVCPGCGAMTEHPADDPSSFYAHVGSCPQISVPQMMEVASTAAEAERQQAQMEVKPVNKFFSILQMIPSIISTVKAVEAAFPQSGSGPHKLDTVLNTINVAAAAVPEVQNDLQGVDLNKTVTDIVNATVAGMNAANGK